MERNSDNFAANELPKERFCIGVVCNSKHHAINLLGLAETLSERHPHIGVVAICESADFETYLQLIDSDKTTLMTLDGSKTTDKTSEDSVKTTSGPGLLNRPGIGARAINFALRINKKLGGEGDAPSFLAKILRESSLGCYLRETRAVKYWQRRIGQAKGLLNKYNAKVVFAFGDRHIDIEAPILVAARELGLKTVIPYGTSSGRQGLISVREALGDPKRWLPFSIYRLIVGARYPEQVYKGYFYQHPCILRALHRIGALSENPWNIGNGLSDIVCVDNDKTAKRYESEGVRKDKLLVMGDLSNDDLYMQMEYRQEFISDISIELELDSNKKNLVLAMPQFAEQGVLDWDSHWREIEFILDTIIAKNYNVVISLHPRMDKQKYVEFLKPYPVKIAPAPLKQLLPLADAFVAINSSTVLWATLIGIPALIMNWYELDVSLFADFENIDVINEREQLSATLDNLKTQKERDFSKDWNALSRNKVFDGQVVNRYLDLVTNLNRNS